MARNGEVRFSADFEAQIIEAIEPTMRGFTDSVNNHLRDQAPKDTGTLADAVHADLDPHTGVVEVGVERGHINPRTHQDAADYAPYVIQGTSEQHADDFTGRAVDLSLQELREH